MPITTPRPSKRKHAEGGASGDGSAKKTKEERRAEKRAKREAEEASPIRKKEKVNGVGSVARTKTAAPKTSDTEFKLVRARAHVSLPPRFAGDARRGVEEILDNLVMRYVPSLRGVLLSHRSHSFAQSVALLYAEGPYPTTEVEFDAGVWAPEVGMRITGRISLHATDHIGLLVHRTFNVSISRTHIPGDGDFEYVHGPVANDPEINTEERQGDEESGRWINSQTGETLGGESGLVEFTVIGYTIANQMLSLHGSLQPDPFAPEHYTARQTTAQPNDSAQAEDDTDMADNRIIEGSDDEVDAEDEDLAAPRGSKRKLVDIIPVPPETQKEAGPAKRKKKKAGVANGEASVVVIEAGAGAVEREGKKKSKKKKAAAAEADGVGA